MKSAFSSVLLGFLSVLLLSGCGTFVSRQVTPQTPTEENIWSNWDDRTVFSSGLISSEQETLQQLHGASIYHIDISISEDMTTIKGREEVRFTNQESSSLDSVCFQLYPNQLGGKITVSDVTVNDLVLQQEYSEGESAICLTLTSPLQPAENVLIKMDFEVAVPTEGGGNYGLFAVIDNILALDGFYPMIPAYDDEGWHVGPLPANADTTYNDVSFYLVRVTAPTNLVMVTSGVEVANNKSYNQQQVTFAAGPARDFYLAASPDFIKVSRTIGETTVNSYAFSEWQKGAEKALNVAVEALENFNKRYGDYPYTEFDVASTPMQGAIGIEYPGVVGITRIAYDPDQIISGAPAFVILETTIAHEVGHQWFYNSVGNDQAGEPWLDESLTQYITSMYFLDEYGQNGMDQYRENWFNRWNRVSQEEIPLGKAAAEYQGPEYSAIIYGRGPIFLQELADKMGQEIFAAFLLDYAQTYQWQVSTTADFKQLAEEHCQCDLTTLFEKWVYLK